MKLALTSCDHSGSPPATVQTAAGQVDVWWGPLDIQRPEVRGTCRYLSEGELTRADRFRFQEQRDRFVLRRGLLRAVLARYVDTEPAALQFCLGPHGKPELAGTDGRVRFNTSSSGDVAAIAVTCEREVGVDLERVRCDPGIEQIIESFFSLCEASHLWPVQGERRTHEFFQYWTLKEAFLKATGRGLTVPPEQFEIQPNVHDSAARVCTPWDSSGGARWSLRQVYTAPGYMAAVAIEGPLTRLRCWRWKWPASTGRTQIQPVDGDPATTKLGYNTGQLLI